MSTRKIAELKIGDVVKLLPINPNDTFNEMTVIAATTAFVKFFRPYVHLGDFTHTGGVTPYIGIEEFEVPLGHPAEYEFLENIYRGQP